MFIKSVAILLAIFCLKAFSNDKIIYGEDNRVDFYDSRPMFQELSKSTAAMIPKVSLVKSNNEFKIKAGILNDRVMCKDEPFREQITAAYCSGFLVGEDLLVTAGHCITDKNDCKKYAWVFEYRLDYEGDKANTIEEANVFYCEEIIERKLNFFKNDYALIRLNKKVIGKRPLEFRKSGKVQDGENLVVIGHPSGLPTKIADGAVVRSRSWNYFTTNLDTFAGNSGSAVFNVDTAVVEGILVRGGTDYVTRKNCNISNRIGNDEGHGEDVTYITNIKYLKKL